MEAGIIAHKFSKKERRVVKKQLKLRDTLLRHERISCCDYPTKHLVVGNAGLGNGVEREQLYLLFQRFGDVVDIVTKPRKPYAFVSFSSVDDATAAMLSLNGQPLVVSQHDDISVDGTYAPNNDVDNTISATDVPRLYLLYVEQYSDDTQLSTVHTNSANLPAGLVLLNDFISPDEEQILLLCLDWQRSDSELLKHRRVLHYGYKFMYSTSDIDRHPLTNKIPAECYHLLERLRDEGLITSMPDQLTVNQYLPGQGIPPHVDTHSAFEDTIIIVTLQSQVVMEFRKSTTVEGDSDERVNVLLPRRSVALMSGESRYEWTHGITPRTMDIVSVDGADETRPRLTIAKRGTRISLTFRTLRQSAVCNCCYVQQCDSQRQHIMSTTTMIDPIIGSSSTQPQSTPSPATVAAAAETRCLSDDSTADQLEAEHVHKVYERIASHFSDTRHSAWPRVAQFIQQLAAGSLVVDVGCGNGKYLGINKDVFMLGCDRSGGLCDICRSRGYESLTCDGLSLPMRSESCDAVLCIAVIHHLSTQVRRLNAILELVRLLRVGGRALIYVWALEQEKGNVRAKYLKPSKASLPVDCSSQSKQDCGIPALPVQPRQDGGVPGLPVHVNGTAFKSQDILVPWHLKETKKQPKPNKDGRRHCETRRASEQVSSPKRSASPPNTDVKTEGSEQVLHRYYHTFVEGELVSLCKQLSNITIVDSYYDQGNWCVVIERIL